MKRLFLVRHAKSDWIDPVLRDHDRPLNDRGKSDLPRMGSELRRREASPCIVLTSTAVRALATARGLASALGVPEDRIVTDRELYLAPPGRILQNLSLLPEATEVAMLCAHNPGLHETVLALAPAAQVPAFPTLAVAEIRLRIDYWGEIDRGCGELLDLTVPRSLPG